MKVAVQLSGYFNNREDPQSGLNGYAYIQKEIVQKVKNVGGSVDFFIHSWEPDREGLLRSLYQPKLARFQKQFDFGDVIRGNNLADHEYYDRDFDRAHSMYAPCNLKSTLSFLYGRFDANRLRTDYEVETEIEYDCVISARFDLGQRDKFGNWKYRVSQIRFDPTLDMNFVYSSMWDQLNCGLADQWFFSSPANMDNLNLAYVFATSYYAANDRTRRSPYFSIGSEYEIAVTTGWPDSRPVNVFDPNDPNQFTNEMLLPPEQKSKELMKYPLWQCVNNHILYKWIAIDMGLYSKLRFV